MSRAARNLLLRRASGSGNPPPLTSDFAVYGDSMAAEFGLDNDTQDGWITYLLDLIEGHLGRRPLAFKYGIPGSRLGTAAQLQMGHPMRFTVAGGSIPAAAVEVDITAEDPEFDLYDSGTALDGSNPKIGGFQLAGVNGSVHRRDPGDSPFLSLTFTRDVAVATATPAPGLQTLTHLPGLTHRTKNMLGWVGHNNRSPPMNPNYIDHEIGTPYSLGIYTDMLTFAQGKAAFFGYTSSPAVPERVGGSPTGAMNQEYLDIFGTDGYGGAVGDLISLCGPERFIDVRAGLLLTSGPGSTDPNLSAWAYTNTTPTATDLTQTGPGNRYPGASLRKGNSAHLNTTGQKWPAKCAFDHMVRYGWLV